VVLVQVPNSRMLPRLSTKFAKIWTFLVSGYVSSETEIYIIIAEDFEKDRDSPAALKESGKYTTSSQFTSDNTDKSTQANVHILSPCN